ncbi:MAG TPA: flagellar hook assembly protein FlgD [Spirochaetota bacterium]|nr:flagellar hook assembly protein FlgD [Spirochaetota bacterium]HPP03775.1 flagellar hook assembly protein FlgD [Spirochaetota bacterium]
MEGINDFNMIDLKQNSTELFKTKTEVETLNKSLKKDGKEIVKNLGKDEFLKLLITELQNQDPTNPMQDREFIAQMAQFSSLEQMLNMNKNMESFLDNLSFSSSFDMLGKKVEIDDSSSIGEDGKSKIVRGVVEAVTRQGNETYVRVDGKDYPVSAIYKVGLE